MHICCKFQQKKKKEKLKFLHTIKNDFSCVYGNAVEFNADPKFLMFLLLLLLFLFEGVGGVHKFETVLLNSYCKTHKTRNSRFIHGMFLCREEKANKQWEI